MSTWLETIVEDLEGLGSEFNVELEAASLEPLVDWYQGEPRPIRQDSTPYGWFHFRPTDDMQPVYGKAREVTNQAPMLLAVVMAAGTGDELMDQVAATLPELTKVLETRAWPCGVALGGWELADQDPEINCDIYVMPVTLSWTRALGATA